MAHREPRKHRLDDKRWFTLDLRAPGAQGAVTAHIHLFDGNGSRHEWIKATHVDLTASNRSNDEWLLEVRVPGVTDADHDTAVALRMVVAGVHVVMIQGGQVWIRATIDGSDPETFRVPSPGWSQLAGAMPCPLKGCKKDQHLVVPDGQWIPRSNPELFDLVRGMRIEIITGGLP